MTADLFPEAVFPMTRLKPGVALFRARLGADAPKKLLNRLLPLLAVSPFRQMQTPRGFQMSVAMSNCGDFGWITDRKGYRYAPLDPLTDQPWPAMPEDWRQAAIMAALDAGFPDFLPNACLINRYAVGAKMGLHQDRDEAGLGRGEVVDRAPPIVSFSFGLPAIFLLGGATRRDETKKYRLEHGDVLVWGGPARLDFHGVRPIRADCAPSLLPPELGECRINLTFRRADPGRRRKE